MPRELILCPSEAAYRRHIARGEPVDDACRQAHNELNAKYRPNPGPTGVHTGERPLGPGECGTLRGYRWHRKAHEPQCQACKDAQAADVRSRYGKATGTKPGRTLAPCGTPAAYQRHLAHGEEPCPECRAANLANNQLDWQASRIVAAMTHTDTEAGTSDV